MTGKLYIQYDQKGNRINKDADGETVDLNIDKNGEAQAFKDNAIFATMSRVKLDWAAAKGMYLSGVEYLCGNRDKARYQEWWFVTEKE